MRETCRCGATTVDGRCPNATPQTTEDAGPVRPCPCCGTTLRAEYDDTDIEAISGNVHYAGVCREYVAAACRAKDKELTELRAQLAAVTKELEAREVEVRRLREALCVIAATECVDDHDYTGSACPRHIARTALRTAALSTPAPSGEAT